MAWPLVAAAIAAPILGGIAGNEAARGDDKAARDARARALAELSNLYAPGMTEQMVNFDEYQNMGQLTPELEDLFQQEKSAMEGISLDPNTRAAQMQALSQLKAIVDGGGYSDAEKAKLESMFQDTSREMAGQNQAIKEDMARRGMGGSGLELAQRMQANEESINRRADNEREIAGMASDRALSALNQMYGVAGGIEDRSFGQQSDKARASDIINQFNTSLRQRQGSTNTALRNDAQKYNLGNRQDIANKNVDIRNQEQQRNKDLYQTRFQNQKDIAALKSGAYNDSANQSAAEADAKRRMWSGIGTGVGTMAGAAAGKGK